ncbi:BON domain-containing protein [Burkholderia sp. THE68]|uniref:BON domain-containing protein n=1 Tax=Burkholderia sp. THE68 TaxID=758782 RepID=UPI001576280D|nr:BON domain-containing protein [Burkholderia sp. THE68]
MEDGVRTKRTVAVLIASLFAAASMGAYAQGGSGSASTVQGKTATNKAADRALQKRVRAALAKDKNVTVSNITVRARGGDVTLQGSVPAQDELERAAEVAKGVPGVNSVNNALTIRTPGQ